MVQGQAFVMYYSSGSIDNMSYIVVKIRHRRWSLRTRPETIKFSVRVETVLASDDLS